MRGVANRIERIQYKRTWIYLADPLENDKPLQLEIDHREGEVVERKPSGDSARGVPANVDIEERPS